MKLLAMNHHVAYLSMLADTGHQIYVLNPMGRFWDERQRPLHPNVKVVTGAMDELMFCSEYYNSEKAIDEWEKKAITGPKPGRMFDAILFQDFFLKTEQGPDLYDRLATMHLNPDIPRICLFHNSFKVNFNGASDEEAAALKIKLKEMLKGIKCVFISEFKKQSYGLDGDVILPGFSAEIFGGWRGIDKGALTCLNNAMSRDFMNGTRKTQLATIDYPHLLLGEEGGKGQLAPNFEEYKQTLRAQRVYICLNNEEFEDGYNLSMLEFMMTGGPAITLDHPTSPIKSGVNGFKSDDIMDINKFLHTLTFEDAYKMGCEARTTVIKKFPFDKFQEGWNKALGMK